MMSPYLPREHSKNFTEIRSDVSSVKIVSIKHEVDSDTCLFVTTNSTRIFH